MKSILESPISIGGCVAKNRLYRAPVLEGAGNGDDAPSIYRKAFEENARSGVGLIIQGNSCISAEGRSSPGMTLVNTRKATLRLSEVTSAVHAWGGRIFLQIGHAGIYAMEGWHRKFAEGRREPLIAVSPPPVHVKAAVLGVPIKVLNSDEIEEVVRSFARSAAWAREAGYDGVQLASSNAKLIHQFLSPFYNRRSDEFGGTLRNRARILEVIAASIRAEAGEDFPIAVKIPMGEDAPPFSPRIGGAEGLELCRLAQEFGFSAVTPVGLSVFPHASLCRGDYPKEMLDTASIKARFEEALGEGRIKQAVLRWGYWQAARRYPFEAVWNRNFFREAKRVVSIPVFAIGGIRSRNECLEILDAEEADLVGMGRPFYAEGDLATSILKGGSAEVLCESSNRCLPAQQLGMKARCYNPSVARKREAMKTSREASEE